jgi:hypothetical protein
MPLDDSINFRVEKTFKKKVTALKKHILPRDLMKLGFNQFLKENPHLKMELLNLELDTIEVKKVEMECDKNDLVNKAVDLVIRSDSEFFKQFNIDKQKEFVEAFLNIKYKLKDYDSLEEIPDKVYAFESIAVNMETEEFKEAMEYYFNTVGRIE